MAVLFRLEVRLGFEVKPLRATSPVPGPTLLPMLPPPAEKGPRPGRARLQRSWTSSATSPRGTAPTLWAQRTAAFRQWAGTSGARWEGCGLTPTKLLDGYWFALDGQWIPQASKFTTGPGYAQMQFPTSDGLNVTRTEFSPDANLCHGCGRGKLRQARRRTQPTCGYPGGSRIITGIGRSVRFW